MNLTPSIGKVNAVFIVRDKDGNVKFDDWDNIPDKFIPHLTEEDLNYIKQKQLEKN